MTPWPLMQACLWAWLPSVRKVKKLKKISKVYTKVIYVHLIIICTYFTGSALGTSSSLHHRFPCSCGHNARWHRQALRDWVHGKHVCRIWSNISLRMLPLPSVHQQGAALSQQRIKTASQHNQKQIRKRVPMWVNKLIQPVSTLCTDDFNRVKLKPVEDIRGSDYINASYVNVSK